MTKVGVKDVESFGGSPIHGLRILVVEDDSTLCQLVCEVLRGAGADVLGVASGDVAINHFDCSAGSENSFDAAVVDLRLPVLSGFDTLRALRALCTEAKLIAISGGLLDQQTQDFLSKSRITFLPKPFGVSELVLALEVH